jgi:DNA-binding CsgD family transcriptional regulator
MPQINDFFIDKNRVDGITEDDYEQVRPKIEAVAAAARTTTNSIYVIDYHKRNFLYASENPMLAPVGLKEMGYALYLNFVPKEEQAMLLEINRVGFEEFSRIDLEEKMDFVISYDFHFVQNGRCRMVNHRLTPLALNAKGQLWLALCSFSLSSRKEFGNVRMWRVKESGNGIVGNREVREYSLMDGKWHKCEPIALNETEQSLLMMSAQGYTTEEIAERLFRSTDTMKYHRKKLFRKLGVESINEAVALVMSSNVI